MTKEIITIVGARPQFVKAAALSLELKKISDEEKSINEKILHSGQHYDEEMSDKFFDELNIPKPTYNLGIGGGTHGQNTGRMIEGIEQVLFKEKPDGIVVYGDTDTTLAGALAASKIGIPIFHVESGLRSFDRDQPEEINRILTDHLSEICFAPTKEAEKNLKNEGIKDKNILITGDIMADVSRIFSKKSEAKKNLLKKYKIKPKDYALVTIHRKSNTDNFNRLKSILLALNKLEMKIIFPIHPRTLSAIENYELISLLEPFIILKPVGFLDMIMLEKNAAIIITDSGGVQKEAYFHKTPCVTIRDQTEWIELTNYGWNKLADANNVLNMLNSFNHQLSENLKNELIEENLNLYGNGFSSQNIVNKLKTYFYGKTNIRQ